MIFQIVFRSYPPPPKNYEDEFFSFFLWGCGERKRQQLRVPKLFIEIKTWWNTDFFLYVKAVQGDSACG